MHRLLLYSTLALVLLCTAATAPALALDCNPGDSTCQSLQQARQGQQDTQSRLAQVQQSLADAQQKAKRVDEDVPLAARDFLRAIIALRIERRPPFGVPLTLWLSMMAAVGLASRPSCSRTATYNA